MSLAHNYKHPWNRRLWDLMGAMGWNLQQASIRLGCKTRLPLNRVLNGGRPKIDFLLTLQKLENLYAGEIKEFIKQQRPFKKFARQRRAKLRLDRLNHESSRPSDIAEMGQVDALGEDGWERYGGDAPVPSRVVYWTDPRRYKRKNTTAQ